MSPALKKFLLLFFSLLFAFGLAEAGLRFFVEPPPEPVALNLVEADQPYAYRLNPAHPEISPQGLRDRVFEIPKPAGTFRILALGDSVTYGLFVPAEKSFPKQLERVLKENHPRLEVMNAGVNGYSTYNEAGFYQALGASFAPDLVLLGFCPNDITDPTLHWHDREGYFRNLPQEAFPDPERHRLEVAPRFYGRGGLPRFLEHAALYRFWETRKTVALARDKRFEPAAGKNWPVYVADDDTDATLLSLTRPDSKEWQWLGGQLIRLDKAVKEKGGRLVVLVLPLSYQTEPGYPFHPETVFLEFCRQNQIACWDPLPALREKGGPSLYMGRHRYHPHDVWHFSEKGNAVVAGALADFLEAENLVPREWGSS
ncbi:MAG TPA: GDSL-type esterase/lipase family protein [Verrucomicrobiae bacterium]|nr:GDSL-type esterase/lipase family protein [Verrucomicrobiae bacterium]